VSVHGPPIRVSGRAVRDRARLTPGDTLVVGRAVLRLDGAGPEAAPRGGAGWSLLEASALLVALAGLAIAGWMVLAR
jgi:hypothetical protein